MLIKSIRLLKNQCQWHLKLAPSGDGCDEAGKFSQYLRFWQGQVESGETRHRLSTIVRRLACHRAVGDQIGDRYGAAQSDTPRAKLSKWLIDTSANQAALTANLVRLAIMAGA